MKKTDYDYRSIGYVGNSDMHFATKLITDVMSNFLYVPRFKLEYKKVIGSSSRYFDIQAGNEHLFHCLEHSFIAYGLGMRLTNLIASCFVVQTAQETIIKWKTYKDKNYTDYILISKDTINNQQSVIDNFVSSFNDKVNKEIKSRFS
jgi:hypothetical protein